MNFAGHLMGGVTAGAVVAGIAATGDVVQRDIFSLRWTLDKQLGLESHWQISISLFAITCFMALFPDLDISSVPQRWFFRIVLLILGVLFLNRQWEFFSAVAFLSILPLVHKHRGWTHWPVTPFLIVVFMAVALEYYHSASFWSGSFSWENVISGLKIYWIYAAACVAGHYTHLFLDSRFLKKIF